MLRPPRREITSTSPAPAVEVGVAQSNGSSTGSCRFLSAGFSLSMKCTARRMLIRDSRTCAPDPVPKMFARVASLRLKSLNRCSESKK